MKQMPDECVDLVVTSPPYDSLRSYQGYVFDFFAVARQLVRVLKIGGVIVWVVADETKDGSESGTSFKQALYFMAKGLNLHDTMIYEKECYMPLNHKRYEQVFEYMFVFSKGTPKTFNPKTKPNKHPGKVITGKRRQNGGDDLLPIHGKKQANSSIDVNIWRYGTGWGHTYKEKFVKEHPAVFPEALAKDHILSWSNPGDFVFDPMCGSGTVLKMAKLYERQYLGFDISPKYVKLAQRRLASIPEVMPLQTLAASNTAYSRLGEGSRQNDMFSTGSDPVSSDGTTPTPCR